MRFLRDDVLLRRAGGATLLLGLLGTWARHWRESATDYDAANNVMHTLFALGVVGVVYVSLSLLVTVRTPTPERSEVSRSRDDPTAL